VTAEPLKRSGALASTAARTLTDDELAAEHKARIDHLAKTTALTRQQAKTAVLAAAREDWERQQMQKRMQRASRDVLAKYLPRRPEKHPRGATKPTIEAKKAKNRARRKANKGNR